MTDDAKRLVDTLRNFTKHCKLLARDPYLWMAGIMGLSADMIEKMSTDRDAWKRRCEAAERDIDHCCSTCQYHHVFFNGCTPDHDCTNPSGACSDDCDRWQWRGPSVENEGQGK